MITWMQRHKKWLIITIWISTIAFVGAGFVGWGAYDFGKSQGTIATVGNREISMTDLQQEYNAMFNQYKQMFGGQFNDEAAKKMQLENTAMQSLIQKNLYLAFANDIGLDTTDEEVAKQVVAINAFHKNGKFDKETYVKVLAQNKTNPTEFEKTLKDGILLEKIKLVFANDINLNEVQNVGKLFFLEDDIKIEIINRESINAVADDVSLKDYYEKNKTNFKSPVSLALSMSKIAILNNDQNKTKENALKEYLKLKKGESKFTSSLTVNSTTLPFAPEDNEKILNAKSGDVIKPFIFKNEYVIVKLENKIEPKVLSFEEAKPLFLATVTNLKKDILIKEMAKTKSNNNTGITISGVTRESITKVTGLNESEAGMFLQQLFSATEKRGFIMLNNKAVVYEILASRFGNGDSKKDLAVHSTLNNLKDTYKFENLVTKLQAKYDVKSFVNKDTK